MCGIHFSQCLLGICGYGDNGGYWDFGSIVSSCEHVQGDGVASINVVGIIVAVREGKVRAVVDVGEWSGCHPRICDTKANFTHSGVGIQKKMRRSYYGV